MGHGDAAVDYRHGVFDHVLLPQVAAIDVVDGGHFEYCDFVGQEGLVDGAGRSVGT